MTSFAVPLRRSIRFRLSLIIAAVIFAAVMATTTTTSLRDLRRAADSRAEMIGAAASAYAAAVAEPLAARDRQGAFEFMRGMRSLPSVVFMSVSDSNGEILAQLGAGASVRGKTADLRQLVGLDLLNADRGAVTIPVVKGGVEIGALHVLADITDLRADLFATLAWTTMVALIAIAGGVALAQFFINRITRPIRSLATIMAKVGANQDFSHRIAPSRRRDETDVLGDAFNGMIDNIRDRDRRIAHHMETLEQTVQQRTSDLQLAKDDAEAANAAKSDFLATMSHEIRTPMNGMMVMAEMLAAADLSPRHRRYAEIISRSGASLLTIINDILDLSKIEAGKLDLEAVPFSPEAMMEDVASLFWEKARSKQLELAIHIGPDVPVSVIGDPTRLNQVVTNLVNNALKFTDTGGVAIDVASEPDGDRTCLRIAVRDTGVGIPASRIGAIFEAFSQADQSTTRKFGGTGLGLAVCKRLTDAMAGDIQVTSEPGKGSTFTVRISLPVETPAPVRPEVAGLPLAVATGMPLLSGSILTTLRNLGLTPRVVASPAMARPGEIVLTLSDLLVREGGAPGAFNICLTDVGDNHADGLIRNGAAVDLLPLPLGRQVLWETIARAARKEFRGTGALEHSQAAAPTASFRNLAILAVDDNAVNREVLREALLGLGAEGHFVTNGADAVEAASRKAYDIIFMDGSMPEMDGFTATRLIREAESSSGARSAHIVALTAQVRGADADAWAAAGADRHMTKPFTSARLREAIEAASSGVASDTRRADPDVQPDTAPVGLIDEAAVATMEHVGSRSGRDVVAKVWKLFLGQAPDALFKLETLAQAKDADAVGRQAHFLKSMALSAGAARLAAVCEDIESRAKSGALEAACAAIADLRPGLDLTMAEMSARLSSRQPGARASA